MSGRSTLWSFSHFIRVKINQNIDKIVMTYGIQNLYRQIKKSKFVKYKNKS